MREIVACTSLVVIIIQLCVIPNDAAPQNNVRTKRQDSSEGRSSRPVFIPDTNRGTSIPRQTFVRVSNFNPRTRGTSNRQPVKRPTISPTVRPSTRDQRQETPNSSSRPVVNTGSRGPSRDNRRTGTRPEFDLVGRIIQQALRTVRIEDRFLELRLLLGIDKTVTQFTSPEPRIFSESPLDVTHITRQSRVINWIATMLRDFKLNLPISVALSHPVAVNASVSCPYVTPSCNINAKYRTIDGTCNNVNRLSLGAAFTPMAREMAPVYENDPLGKVDLPRSRGKLGPLPSARHVSAVIHADRGAEESTTRWSQQLTLWGQMLAHDITDRAPGKGFNGAVMACCNQRIKTPFCNVIDIPDNDLFRERGQSCMEFVRSAEVTDLDCKLGRREQLNQASSYIDAGFIYGVTNEKLTGLRTGTRGMLITSSNGHLPIIPHPNAKASIQGFAFFAAGDDRVNEHTGLMGIETVWVREHNRIAEVLGGLNPSWNDETVFQETRRIITAIFQHITYNEYLPQVIGEATMTYYNLWPLKEGYYRNYSAAVDPSASNAFTTAVYRFGHSMIRNKFSLMDRSFNMTDSRTVQLKETFFTSITFLETEHTMMRGAMMDQSEPCDRMLSSDLRNNLHQTKDGNGRDLAALNIQRGREHGLPSYTAFREHYGFSTITEFTNGTNGFVDHPFETTELMRQVYSHPSDVDLWTGGISELPVDEAAVGPLFAHMLAQQFKRLKNGDRYFYESDAQPVPFTPEQLQEIRKVTYASVLCYNLHFATIQPEAFLLTKGSKNVKVPCTSIPSMNLLAWRERS